MAVDQYTQIFDTFFIVKIYILTCIIVELSKVDGSGNPFLAVRNKTKFDFVIFKVNLFAVSQSHNFMSSVLTVFSSVFRFLLA